MQRIAAVLAPLLAGALPVACGGLPASEGRRAAQAMPDTDDTWLGRAIAPRASAHPHRSGVVALADARDAFASRVLLADAAERSLDVQYYIWHGDRSGTLLFNALYRAAERGVHVRLLLDDNNTAGLDVRLRALDAHPNIEVRLFNPFALRGARWLGYLSDFTRLNRRMHNKSFTADHQATIVGGRNVGDEYFDVDEERLFFDLDVLAVGPVVREVSKDFERYWTSGSAYPVDRILPAAGRGELERLAARAAQIERDPAAAAYVQALRESDFVRRMLAGELAFEWSAVRLVSDDPAKALGRAAPEALIDRHLLATLGEPARELHLVSAYFVPTAAGVEAFAALARRGVKVWVLTNSLAATDVAAVHAGYAKRRKALLQAGVALFEMKPTASSASAAGHARLGRSASSLHAKTFAVDRTRVYVGSFNFDPRSARLNTEMGLVIDSAALAGQLADAFATDIAQHSYELRLGPRGALQWLERQGDRVVLHDTEPGSGIGLRAAVWLLSLLPIEWLL